MTAVPHTACGINCFSSPAGRHRDDIGACLRCPNVPTGGPSIRARSPIMDGSGRWYDDVRLGETFTRSVTVTETHLVLGAGLIGDFNPHHVDAEYARKSRFGTRILHGMITSALMGAPVGMYFHGTAIAYLEHSARFRAPVRAGDTLTTTWKVTDRHDKPKHGGGVVVLQGVCVSQHEITVADADARILVHARS